MELEEAKAIVDMQFETKDLETCIYEAIGAASVCWESMEGTGVFQDVRAKAIGDQLLARIRLFQDRQASVEVAAPTEPGWYAYSGGRQTMIFLLRPEQQWFVIADNGSVAPCKWGYIEQALGVWDLVRLVPERSNG